MATFEYEGRQVHLSDEGVFSFDSKRFDNWPAVVAHCKRVARERYTPVVAWYYGYKGTHKVTITRPHNSTSSWIVVEKKRETVSNANLISTDCEAELMTLIEKYKASLKVTAEIEEQIEKLPRSPLPKLIE